jgi:hypothetical protein
MHGVCRIHEIQYDGTCFGLYNLQLIGELENLTTKIITLLEFLNFVSEVSRLLYE